MEAWIVFAGLGSSVDALLDGAGAFFSNLAAIYWPAFGVALGFYLGMLLCRTRAWQNALRAAYPGEKVSYVRITAAYVAGAGINGIIPARAGDALKIFLAKNQIPNSSYPAIGSSFLIHSPFDLAMGLLVLVYAITQGLLPRPPELPELPAFDISFWASNPRLLVFFVTVLAIGFIVAFSLLARRVELFWARIKQGVVIFTDFRRYLREVVAWQVAGWIARGASFWFFLEAFNIGGSLEKVLLVMSVQSISTLLPFTPGGVGAQQALLVATLEGSSAAAVLSYSVGQQIAIGAWAALLGFASLLFVFKTTNWRGLVAQGRAAQAEAQARAHTGEA